MKACVHSSLQSLQMYVCTPFVLPETQIFQGLYCGYCLNKPESRNSHLWDRRRSWTPEIICFTKGSGLIFTLKFGFSYHCLLKSNSITSHFTSHPQTFIELLLCLKKYFYGYVNLFIFSGFSGIDHPRTNQQLCIFSKCSQPSDLHWEARHTNLKSPMAVPKFGGE